MIDYFFCHRCGAPHDDCTPFLCFDCIDMIYDSYETDLAIIISAYYNNHYIRDAIKASAVDASLMSDFYRKKVLK